MDFLHKLSTNMLWNGKTLELNLAFDVVLRLFDLQCDKLFNDNDEIKIDLSLQMLVVNYSSIRKLHIEEKAQILKCIYEDFINIKSKATGDSVKLFDFKQDASHIYSSFMMDYKIDLFECQGVLDWRKFMALLQGLSSHTKLRQIMEIRGREIPDPNKYNASTIKSIRDAKNFYALDNEDEEGTEQFKKGLTKLAGMLEGLAGS